MGYADKGREFIFGSDGKEFTIKDVAEHAGCPQKNIGWLLTNLYSQEKIEIIRYDPVENHKRNKKIRVYRLVSKKSIPKSCVLDCFIYGNKQSYGIS